jgi:hypothetical protein
MTQIDRLSTLENLTDELLVVSTLLDMMTAPLKIEASMLELCAASASRCQHLVVQLLEIEGTAG